MAQQMGIPPEQLAPLMQALQQIPLEQMAAKDGRRRAWAEAADLPGTIQLTQEEMEAVQRLESLGYSRQQAAQAFLACDKNEMLAANMLMDVASPMRRRANKSAVVRFLISTGSVPV